MYNRQNRGVACGDRKGVVFVTKMDLAAVALDFQAIAQRWNDCTFVEAIGNFFGQALDQSEIEDIASRREPPLDAHAHLVIMAVQRLTKAGISDKVRGGEFQVLLGHMNRKLRLHRKIVNRWRRTG